MFIYICQHDKSIWIFGGRYLRVYILDRKNKSLTQMLMWASEDKSVTCIKVFEDYLKFIEQVGNSPPDFCIIRLGLDGIPGLKTASMVKEIIPNVRIVFISDDRDYALEAYEAGAYGYLLCPIKRDKLVSLLKRSNNTNRRSTHPEAL